MTDTPTQPEPMRVLVAIDGSAASLLAVDLVCGIRWPAGTGIVVVEAVESGEGLYGGPWPALAMLEQSRLEAEIRSTAEQDVRTAGASEAADQEVA